ncbi:MAG: hypothetical protein ACUVRS_07250 [Armatimonadota bacterium]
MSSRYSEIDLTQLATISIRERESTVSVEQFAKTPGAGCSASELLNSLPDILAGRTLRAVIDRIVNAHKNRKPVVLATGAHVIKCGLSPIIIKLLRENIITAVAMNGAGAIHESEIALFGKTSEKVEDGLRSGTFGTTRETAEFVNRCAVRAYNEQLGFGESLGKNLIESSAPHADKSILAMSYELGVPATIHVSLGCDVVHIHPNADGAAIGECSLRDFRILTHAMRDLGNGGVLLNVGSAVVLPEVILKSLATLTNLGYDLAGATTVNLDFIQHYRSNKQVVERIRKIGGEGFSLTGHHEIMVPLIACGVIDMMSTHSDQ